MLLLVVFEGCECGLGWRQRGAGTLPVELEHVTALP
jgi:hypothetical protein